MRYSSYIPFPVIQFRKLGCKVGPDLLRQPGFIGHVALQKIQQLIQPGVDKFSVGIAPFAVLLIEGAIWLPADIGVLQRHTTALADQLPGRAKRGVDGDIKQPGKQLQSFCIGHCISGKPPAGSHVLVPPTAPGRVRAWCAVPEGFLWYPYRSPPYPNHTTTRAKRKATGRCSRLAGCFNELDFLDQSFVRRGLCYNGLQASTIGDSDDQTAESINGNQLAQ